MFGCPVGGLGGKRRRRPIPPSILRNGTPWSTIPDTWIPRHPSKCQPEEATSIEPMHGGLAVESVTQMRNALLTRDADQHSRFAVFARLLG